MAVILHIKQRSYRFANTAIDKVFYLEKIRNYKTECGCSLGAIFMISAIISFTGHTLFLVDWSRLNLVKMGLSGLFFIMLAAAVGKLVGITIARVKLKLLYRYLIQERHVELIES